MIPFDLTCGDAGITGSTFCAAHRRHRGWVMAHNKKPPQPRMGCGNGMTTAGIIMGRIRIKAEAAATR
jgi:hypothetical protein